MMLGGLLRICALAALPMAVDAAVSGGGFLSTCHDISMPSVPYIEADCYNGGGSDQHNSQDLNLCIGFGHATKKLAWSVMGKLTNDCESCVLDPPAVLRCLCGTGRTRTANSIDLNEGLVNHNGILGCSNWDGR